MPDHPQPPPNLLDPLCTSAAQAIRAKLEGPLHPHVFDEISVFAKSIYKATTALEPALDLPRPPSGQPLAPAPASESYGVNLARQLVDALTGNRSRKVDRLDTIRAIAAAEKAGLQDEANRLRNELFDEPPDPEMLSPQQRVDRAKRLLEEANGLHEEAKELMASAKPELDAPSAE